MTDRSTIATLNRLLQLHYRSLPMYLRTAAPWQRNGGDPRMAVLVDMADDHARVAGIVADWIQRRGGTIDSGEFPMAFTTLNDLSLDYLIEEFIDYQQQQIGELETCAAALADDRVLHSIAQEAFGAAKGHLRSLQEIREQKRV